MSEKNLFEASRRVIQHLENGDTFEKSRGSIDNLLDSVSYCEQKARIPNPVRVTRILVYTYPDAETAINDQEKWGMPANGVKTNIGRDAYSIRSAVLPLEILEGVQDA